MPRLDSIPCFYMSIRGKCFRFSNDDDDNDESLEYGVCLCVFARRNQFDECANASFFVYNSLSSQAPHSSR